MPQSDAPPPETATPPRYECLCGLSHYPVPTMIRCESCNEFSDRPLAPPASLATPPHYLECDECGLQAVISTRGWQFGEEHRCARRGHFRLVPASLGAATPPESEETREARAAGFCGKPIREGWVCMRPPLHELNLTPCHSLKPWRGDYPPDPSPSTGEAEAQEPTIRVRVTEYYELATRLEKAEADARVATAQWNGWMERANELESQLTLARQRADAAAEDTKRLDYVERHRTGEGRVSGHVPGILGYAFSFWRRPDKQVGSQPVTEATAFTARDAIDAALRASDPRGSAHE